MFAYVVHFGAQALRTGAGRRRRRARPRSSEAARALGAGRAAPLRCASSCRSLRPACSPARGLVLLSAMKELPATLLLAPPGFQTLATQIWVATEDAFFADASARRARPDRALGAAHLAARAPRATAAARVTLPLARRSARRGARRVRRPSRGRHRACAAAYGAQTTGDEPHYLLTALSLAEDGDLDVARRARGPSATAPFHEARLAPQERLLAGRPAW